MSEIRSPSRWLILIVAAYVGVGTLYAVYTPAWQVPDEPAHYNYIHELVSTGKFPIIEMGDYNQEYQNRLLTEKFPLELSISPLHYEDHQPPLFYLLAAPVFWLTGGSLLALRLFSLLLGAGVIVFAFLIAGEVFLKQPAIALGTAAFVAFMPQHITMMASVNNDSLAELLLAAVMWQVFKVESYRLKVSSLRWVTIGVLIGLGLITKLTFYIVVPLVAWGFIRHAIRPMQHASRITHRALLVTLPISVMAIPWWARNIAIYGWPDLMGLARHNVIVAAGGQPTSAWWIEQYGWGTLVQRFLTFTFQSFWGQFGWMTVPMPPRYYLALGALSLIALVGCAWAAVPRLKFILADAWFQLIAAWVLFTVLSYLYYNLTFVQHQGRYLFPALIPLGLAFTVGLRQWTLLLPHPWRNATLALPYFGLVGLDLLVLFRVIIPWLR